MYRQMRKKICQVSGWPEQEANSLGVDGNYNIIIFVLRLTDCIGVVVIYRDAAGVN